MERTRVRPGLIGLAHQRRLQGDGLTHSGVAADVEDDDFCIVEFLQVAEGLGLRLDPVKARDLYIGDRFLDEPATCGLGWRLGILLVVLAVNRNPAAIGEGEYVFSGKITGVSKKLTPASRSLEAETYFRLCAKKSWIEVASMAVITSPTLTESRLLRTTVHSPDNG